jgi:bifunctional DNA-binding transcriptional regulator/antitoxin component of YhaV-PrlF toxin-antitoxin module
MATKVGPKGQVVIEQHIRDRLRIEPGMFAVQHVVDDHVEMYFVPGEHSRSLAGAARPHVRRWPTEAELEDSEATWARESVRDYVEETLDARP